MLWLINFFLFDKSGARTLRMGCEQKFQSLNKIISKIFFSKFIFPKYLYKPYVTIKNIFGHIISHIFMFSTMFWVPGVTLLRLLRCTNKRHFVPSKEHSGQRQTLKLVKLGQFPYVLRHFYWIAVIKVPFHGKARG